MMLTAPKRYDSLTIVHCKSWNEVDFEKSSGATRGSPIPSCVPHSSFPWLVEFPAAELLHEVLVLAVEPMEGFRNTPDKGRGGKVTGCAAGAGAAGGS